MNVLQSGHARLGARVDGETHPVGVGSGGDEGGQMLGRESPMALISKEREGSPLGVGKAVRGGGTDRDEGEREGSSQGDI